MPGVARGEFGATHKNSPRFRTTLTAKQGTHLFDSAPGLIEDAKFFALEERETQALKGAGTHAIEGKNLSALLSALCKTPRILLMRGVAFSGETGFQGLVAEGPAFEGPEIAPVLDHHHTVGIARQGADRALDHQEADAPGLQARREFEQLINAGVGKETGEILEDNDLRPERNRFEQLQVAAIHLREIPDQGLGRERHPELIDQLLCLDVEQRPVDDARLDTLADDKDVLGDAQHVDQGPRGVDNPDLAPPVETALFERTRLAGKVHAPRVGANLTGDQPDQIVLHRRVGGEHAKDFSRLQHQAEVAERLLPQSAEGNLFHPEQLTTHAFKCPRCAGPAAEFRPSYRCL